MKWRHTPKPLTDYTVWHKWFAWTPVVIKDHKYWLCFVARRGVFPPDTTIFQQEFLVSYSRGVVKWEYEELVYYY